MIKNVTRLPEHSIGLLS